MLMASRLEKRWELITAESTIIIFSFLHFSKILIFRQKTKFYNLLQLTLCLQVLSAYNFYKQFSSDPGYIGNKLLSGLSGSEPFITDGIPERITQDTKS